jgi:hypothetical protein
MKITNELTFYHGHVVGPVPNSQGDGILVFLRRVKFYYSNVEGACSLPPVLFKIFNYGKKYPSSMKRVP